MPVRTAYAGAAVAGEVLTAANVNKMPGGWLGYAEVTVNQTGITAEVDITGLTVTVTVGTSRRIRVTADTGLGPASTVSNVVTLRVKEGATVLQERDVHLNTVGGATAAVSASVVLTPTAGSHTYKASMTQSVGTGGVQTTVGATRPGFILCEDLGPA